MCGICGKINFNGNSIEPEDILKKARALTHRGPDDEGVYIDGAVGLGSRRLSIIDLETGRQPIHNEDSSIWVVCNGEIYNYRELSDNLKAQGHTFYTRSDTEVIVHLYERYQEECVKHLNGIFAFAIWDKKRKKLFLGRDRLGVKPLFYYQDKTRLIFASEIKAIIEDDALTREVNQEAMYHFFSLNYTPSPLTMFKNIHSLSAGHLLSCCDKGVRISKYWDLAFKENRDASEDRIAGQLKEQLDKSVKMQLVSDVPVGAFLSGGIDSSALVSLMRKNLNKPIKTFNVRFDESSYDESAYAALVAKAFDAEHHEVFCRPQDYIDCLPEIIRYSDNLTVDISMLPLYLVSRLAGQHVKVVLSGDGADELFAGYPTYAADKLAGAYRKLPGVLKNRLIPSLVSRLPVSEEKMSFEFKARRFIQGAGLSPSQAHFSWRMIFSEQDKRELFVDDIWNNNSQKAPWVYQRFYQNSSSREGLSSHQYADIKGWLVDSILAKVDFMSMANSLEARVPYLDHELVEFAAGIPAKLKLNRFTPKYILKQALKDKIPRQILNRSKAGFNIPIGKWLRRELKGLLTDILCPESLKKIGYFNRPYIKELIDGHLSFKKDNGYKLLSLMHFCLWHDKFIKCGN